MDVLNYSTGLGVCIDGHVGLAQIAVKRTAPCSTGRTGRTDTGRFHPFSQAEVENHDLDCFNLKTTTLLSSWRQIK